MNYLSMQQVFNGFVEAMYFADGADADFKDDEGFYMDGQFNNQYELSNQARININILLETIIPKLPDEVYNLTLDNIGWIVFFLIGGHESTELDSLSDECREQLYQLFFNSVFLEIYDNDETQEIELSYSENWS